MLKTTPIMIRSLASLVAVSILWGCQTPQETCCRRDAAACRISVEGTGSADGKQAAVTHPADLPPREDLDGSAVIEAPSTEDANPLAGREAVAAPRPTPNPYLDPTADPTDRGESSVSQPAIPVPEAASRKLNPLARLQQLGGEIDYAQSPDAATELDRLADVISIDLSGTVVADDDLALLAEFPNLQKLDISNTTISDAGIQHLRDLTLLQLLWINNTGISNRGMAHIAGLTNLKSLGLTNTNVTDGGLIHLSRLNQLEYLLLSQSGITDDGLTHLSALTQLEGISLIQTRVTIEGVRRLKQALPNCQIVADAVERKNGAQQPPISAPPIPEQPASDTEPDLGSAPSARAVPVIADILANVHPIQTACGHEQLDRRISKVLRILLSDPLALDMLGQHYLDKTEWQKAVVMLDAAALVAPREPTVRYHLAVALARLGDIESAMPHFMETVGQAAAHYNVGIILYDRGDLAASQRSFTQALQENPSLTVAESWLKDVRQERLAKSRRLDDPASRHARQQTRRVF